MTRLPFVPLVSGVFSPEQVQVHRTGQPRATTPELEASIEAAWRAAARRARRRGLRLYPGPLCRLEDYRVEPGRLSLTLGPTDFRALVGTNWAQPHRYHELGAEYFANPLGVSAALRAADGKLLVVRRGRLVAHHPGWLHVPSGHLEPGPHACDPFRAMCSELSEELGVESGELDLLVCRGLALAADTYKPELVFEAHTRLTAQGVLDRFQAGEHRAALALPDEGEALLRFLSRFRRITPAAQACLYLHGEAAFGQEWAEAARARLGGSGRR